MRPGDGYEPAPQLTLCERGDVNGRKAAPLWRFLRHSLPFPSDRSFDDEADEPNGTLKGEKFVSWAPQSRTDISWNFAKFLIGTDGSPVKRFSPLFETIKLAAEIEALL